MDWNNVADEYEALYETTTVQFLPHFLDVLKPRRGFTLTDVGCGPGVVSIAAAKAGATPSHCCSRSGRSVAVVSSGSRSR